MSSSLKSAENVDSKQMETGKIPQCTGSAAYKKYYQMSATLLENTNWVVSNE